MTKHEPFRPAEPLVSFRRDFASAIARAAAAHGLARIDQSHTPAEHAAKMWPHDDAVQLVLRAASPPLDMANATAFAQVTVALLPMLAPYSAAADLFAQALKVTLGRDGSVVVPNMGPVGVAFVAPGMPKPVLQGASTGSTLNPYKIAGIAVASSELFANPAIEGVLQNLLGESAGPALDAVVFSNQAATAAHPAGILNGIAPLTATAGGGGGNDVLLADMKQLATAIAPVLGAGKLALLMHPAQGVALGMRLTRDAPNVVPLISGAIPAGTVIAVAINAIVSSLSPPEFETSSGATLHMDNAPAPIVDGGAMAAPVRSLWQTASIAVKLYYGATWAVRSPQAVAWIQNVNW